MEEIRKAGHDALAVIVEEYKVFCLSSEGRFEKQLNAPQFFALCFVKFLNYVIQIYVGIMQMCSPPATRGK